MSKIDAPPTPAGFDLSAATVGASVGFVAAYLACRVLNRRREKNDDSFERVMPTAI